ncbi:MAG: tetratricopeptide repeat protein [Calditrichaeota bacterium]|nr:MAG: tetratricopeptide repeat protein [Calditrichota bacterium]
MVRRWIASLCALALIFAVVRSANSQGLKGRWGWGLGLGAQQQYSDRPVTPLGIGGEGVLTYRLTDKVSLNLAAGFSTLGFKATGSKTFFTSVIYGDLLADYEFLRLSHGKLRPFLQAGVGALNFGGANYTLTFPGSSRHRFNDAEVVFGGGLRYFLNPTTAINLTGNAKYTTSDGLDGGLTTNKINDAYFTFRAGITFYRGAKTTAPEENLFTEVPEEETDVIDSNDVNGESEESSEMGGFLSKLSALEGRSSEMEANKQTTMEEYIRLRSRIDELNNTIEKKEREIYALQKEIASKQGNINTVGRGNIAARPNFQSEESIAPAQVNIADIASAYETALNKFYSRRYQEAITIFQNILARYPRHSLASNCQYWIGESYFAENNFRAAIEAFQKVLAYDRSLKKDDALFMMGQAYMKMGQKELAKDAFNQLLTQFPNSEFTHQGRQYLNRL